MEVRLGLASYVHDLVLYALDPPQGTEAGAEIRDLSAAVASSALMLYGHVPDLYGMTGSPRLRGDISRRD